jgi:hypothetical protein
MTVLFIIGVVLAAAGACRSFWRHASESDARAREQRQKRALSPHDRPCRVCGGPTPFSDAGGPVHPECKEAA